MSKKQHKRHIRLAHKGERGEDVVYLDAMVSNRAHREIMTYVGGKVQLTDAEVKHIQSLAGK